MSGRIAGFFAAWGWVVGLALALAGSLTLNAWQWRSCAVRMATAPLKDAIASKDKALNDTGSLLASAQARAATWQAAGEQLAASATAAGRAYRDAARARPLAANCAPGQARLDATNRALGAPSPESP